MCVFMNKRHTWKHLLYCCRSVPLPRSQHTHTDTHTYTRTNPTQSQGHPCLLRPVIDMMHNLTLTLKPSPNPKTAMWTCYLHHVGSYKVLRPHKYSELLVFRPHRQSLYTFMWRTVIKMRPWCLTLTLPTEYLTLTLITECLTLIPECLTLTLLTECLTKMTECLTLTLLTECLTVMTECLTLTTKCLTLTI